MPRSQSCLAPLPYKYFCASVTGSTGFGAGFGAGFETTGFGFAAGAASAEASSEFFAASPLSESVEGVEEFGVVAAGGAVGVGDALFPAFPVGAAEEPASVGADWLGEDWFGKDWLEAGLVGAGDGVAAGLMAGGVWLDAGEDDVDEEEADGGSEFGLVVGANVDEFEPEVSGDSVAAEGLLGPLLSHPRP
jgi:hypothetical protein